eukprot:11100513-Ditylum_brightwellii.AAC.1
MKIRLRSQPKSSKEQCVSFLAMAKSSHTLKLDGGNSTLLTKYMTQPVECYSAISFYGDTNGDSIEDESGRQLSGYHQLKMWIKVPGLLLIIK